MVGLRSRMKSIKEIPNSRTDNTATIGGIVKSNAYRQHTTMPMDEWSAFRGISKSTLAGAGRDCSSRETSAVVGSVCRGSTAGAGGASIASMC